MINKKILTIFILSSLVFSILYVNIVFAGNDDQENEGTYYFAYGDSITAGKSMTPSYSFSKAYMERMRVLYDPSNTSDHIGYEGGGNKVSYDQGTAWDPTDEHDDFWGNPSTRYFYDWVNWSNTYFIFMLGVNDVALYHGYETEGHDYYPPDFNFSVSNYTRGMLKIYNETIENSTIPIMCNPTGCDGADTDRYPGFLYENYSVYYNESFSIFKNYSIKCVPMWDALDLNPWDGFMQQFDIATYQGDGVHPNEDGHDAMAYMLWYFIQGWDYNKIYYAGNDTLIVDADYNETIFINNTRYGWNSDSLKITCLSSETDVPFLVQTAFNGSEMIRFDIEKGNIYQIREIIQFISIENSVNETTIYTSTPTINWTTVTDASQYHLEIDNNADFSSPEINYTDINQWNYPSNCNINSTRVSFTLPTGLSEYNKYYMRVRALTR